MRFLSVFLMLILMCKCDGVMLVHTCQYISAYVYTHVFQNETTVCLHHSQGVFNCLSLSPTLRRSLSSSYVWRLRQTSSASSSSPSNGCFSLPAPTYGSSMSGTQVSPSFLPTDFISASQTDTFTSKNVWDCTRYSRLPSFFKSVFFFYSPCLYFHTERGVCLPTVSLWILFVYIEAAIRFKDLKNFHVDLCRPFAAHW